MRGEHMDNGNSNNNRGADAKMAENMDGFNTIFDDVFRTIAQKMPFLLIPLINAKITV